mmetsp:Transcript_26553/g.68791  ORF Transcript_26553/g.68791 Transcript_26553/m.68791 type:complete len:251 (-) Transcript_26553:1101-1853(-)
MTPSDMHRPRRSLLATAGLLLLSSMVVSVDSRKLSQIPADFVSIRVRGALQDIDFRGDAAQARKINDAVRARIDSALNRVTGATGGISSVQDYAQSRVQAALEYISDPRDRARNAVDSQSIRDEVRQLVDAALAGLVVAGTGDGVRGITDSVRSRVEDVLDEVDDTVEDALRDAADVDDINDEVNDRVDSALAEVDDAVDEAVDEANSAADEGADKAQDAVDGAQRDANLPVLLVVSLARPNPALDARMS